MLKNIGHTNLNSYGIFFISIQIQLFWRIIINKINLKPLFYEEENLICAKKNKIISVASDGTESLICVLPINWLQALLLCSRLLSRLFRLEVYSSAISGGIYFISFQKKLYSFKKSSGKLTCEISFENGHGPLSFCCIDSLEGFNSTIYYGDYVSNPSYEPISIYKRLDNGGWDKCFTFPKNLINHVHGLVKDDIRNCVWILTGDYGSSFGIYKATNNFSKVEPIIIGDQKFRSCVAYPVIDGLLYATDSHLEKNTIRILKNIDDNWVSEEISKINGPVIYGCELLDFFIFATSVEPGLKKSNKISTLLDREKGPGIINNHVEIVAISKLTMKKTILEVNPKDLLPARLFQFGSACFPSKSNSSNRLATYYTATQKYEGELRDIEIKKESINT